MTRWLLTRGSAIHLTYVLLFSIGLGLTPLNGSSQTFPSKPIKLISGATAGSASDIIARSIAEKLQNEFGVPVLVENKPGAAGTVAIQTIFNSPADGHSIFVYTGAHTVLPLINKVSYDPVKDFSAVIPLAVVPNVMVVSPNKGYKSVKDVIAAAKDKPGQLNYASAGLGSATHMSAEKFKLATGIDAVHVPYKGSPEAITETMTGRIDYFFAPLVSALPMIKAGKLVPLAVSTAKRSSQLPDVPTLAEAGIAKSEYLFWIGMLVSAKTPRDIVNKLNQSTLKALQDNEVKERLAGLGAEAMPMSPEQFDQLIKDELISNAAVMKAAGIKSD